MPIVSRKPKRAKKLRKPKEQEKEIPPYDKYERLMIELGQYKKDHRHVFDGLDELNEKIEVVEKKIRDQVRELYKEANPGEYIAYDGRFIRVAAQAKRKRDIDVAKLRRHVPQVFQEHPKLIRTTVDLGLLDKLIDGGEIDRDLINQFVSYAPMTTAVSFRFARASTTDKEGE